MGKIVVKYYCGQTYHETLISRRLYRVDSGVQSYVYLDDPQRKDLLYKAGE